MTPAITGSRGRAWLLGCPLDPLTLGDAVSAIDGAVAERRPVQHSALNAAKVVFSAPAKPEKLLIAH